LLAHGPWFSPDTPASSTTKTGRHDIAEILLKVVLNTINQIKSIISAHKPNTSEFGSDPIPKLYNLHSLTLSGNQWKNKLV
jgi:hypothetical protein